MGKKAPQKISSWICFSRGSEERHLPAPRFVLIKISVCNLLKCYGLSFEDFFERNENIDFVDDGPFARDATDANVLSWYF